MAKSYATRVGDGTLVLFPVEFPYISKDHVKVFVGKMEQIRDLDYTWDGTSIRFVVPPKGTVTIRRVTPTAEKVVPFSDGALLNARILDTNSSQTLYATQETQDLVADTLAAFQDYLNKTLGVFTSAGGVVVVNTGPDLTEPPAITGVSVTATLTNLLISFDEPAYSKNGTSESNHARTEVWVAEAVNGASPGRGAAKLVTTTTNGYAVASIGATGKKLYVWLRNVSRADVPGPWAGGINGFLGQTGLVGGSDLSESIITAGKIAAGAIDSLDKFLPGIEPTTIQATLPAETGYNGPRILLNSTNGKLYRYVGPMGSGTWVASTASADISGQLTSSQIADIAAAKITGQLTDAQLAAISAAKLTGSITATQITDGAVTTPKLAAGSVVAGKIATDAVTASTIAAGAVTAGKIATDAVTASTILAGAVTAGKLAADSVVASNIAAGAVTAGKLAVDAVTAGNIAAGSVTAGKFAAGAIAVGTAAIQNGAITNAMIGDLSADKINAGTLSAARIAAGSIDASKIDTRNLTIKDAAGNVLFGSGTSLSYSLVTPDSGWLNSNVTLGADGRLNGAGGGQVTRQPVVDAGVGSDTFGKRSRDDTPNEYAVGITMQFKDGYALGIGGAANLYGTLETSKPYPDNTGGYVTQFFYADSGATWKRYGRPADASWSGSWVQDLDRRSYTGDLDATKGAPTGTLVAGVPAATVATAATNFNASNDRNSTAVPAPSVAADGTAVDHTLQTDGSADISFEWSWGGSEGDIDGFQVFVYQAASATAYTFGTTPAAETVYQVPAAKRAFVLYGVAADRYYTFGVRAYRAVDKDIAAAGVIQSAVVKPSLAAENPYQPSTSVAFAGNVTGTIDGLPPSAVKNSSISIGADGTLIGAGGGQVTRQSVVDAGNGTTTFGQRQRNDPPSEYSVGVTMQFKDGYALGIGASANFYGTLETYKPYADNSGGKVAQYFYAGSGATWKRYGDPTGTSWATSWLLVYDSSNSVGTSSPITAGNASTFIANAAIQDAHIADLSASKLTAGTIDANNINVNNLKAANITVGTINGPQLTAEGASVVRSTVLASLSGYSNGTMQTFATVNLPAGSYTSTTCMVNIVGTTGAGNAAPGAGSIQILGTLAAGGTAIRYLTTPYVVGTTWYLNAAATLPACTKIELQMMSSSPSCAMQAGTSVVAINTR